MNNCAAENAKKNYIRALEKRLSRLPEKERYDAIEHFTEYLNDMEIENESDIILELGTPGEAAGDILAGFLEQNMKNPEPKKKSNIGIIGIVILAICAAPIALPVVMAVAITGVAVVASAFGFCIAGAAIGIKLLMRGAISFGVSVPGGILIVGIALFVIGISILLFVFAVLLCRWLSLGISNIANSIGKKHRASKKQKRSMQISSATYTRKSNLGESDETHEGSEGDEADESTEEVVLSENSDAVKEDAEGE